MSKKDTARSIADLDGWEHVLVTRINWAIGRQSVTVGLLLTTAIGTITLSRLGGTGAPIIIAPLIVAMIIEFWAIFRFEESIIDYQIKLGEVRFDWKISDSSLIWRWFNKDGKINYLALVLTELGIIVGFVIAYCVLKP